VSDTLIVWPGLRTWLSLGGGELAHSAAFSHVTDGSCAISELTTTTVRLAQA